jgi:hypothetical protein
MESSAPRRIGLDLDNTIIDYEALIREELATLGLIGDLPQGDKRMLRDALRAIDDGEGHWTRLQARIYGPRLGAATPFSGAVDFVHRAAASGIELIIVSHKTPLAAGDTSGHDLHAAARRWLEENRLVGPGAVPPAHVYFEPTRRAKVARIAALGVDAFIDDLVEVFEEPAFPRGVRRWLFSPSPPDSMQNVDRAFASWQEIAGYVLAAD